MNCLLCGSPTHLRFSTKDSYKLMWCSNCEFGRLAGNFTPEQVATFYPTEYYTHAIGLEACRDLSLHERALRHLAWRVDLGMDFDPAEVGQGRSVCDIGCGNGSLLRKFKQLGYETVGIDPDPAAREAAKDAGDIYAGTAEDIPLIGAFDIVIMSHVLEHCIDPVRAVSSAADLLAPSGSLVIEVPNNAATGFNWFGPNWPWTDIPRHLSFFTDTSLALLLERRGLKVTKTRYTGFTRQFLPDWLERVGWFGGWPLLAASAFRADRSKYDSVRVCVKRSNQ